MCAFPHIRALTRPSRSGELRSSRCTRVYSRSFTLSPRPCTTRIVCRVVVATERSVCVCVCVRVANVVVYVSPPQPSYCRVVLRKHRGGEDEIRTECCEMRLNSLKLLPLVPLLEPLSKSWKRACRTRSLLCSLAVDYVNFCNAHRIALRKRA